jgi:hypothetical protein
VKKGGMKKPRDSRDAKKAEDLAEKPLGIDDSQHAAELQIGGADE